MKNLSKRFSSFNVAVKKIHQFYVQYRVTRLGRWCKIWLYISKHVRNNCFQKVLPPPRAVPGLRRPGTTRGAGRTFSLKSTYNFHSSLHTVCTFHRHHVIKHLLSPITKPCKSKIFLGKPWVNHQIWLHNIIIKIDIPKTTKI